MLPSLVEIKLRGDVMKERYVERVGFSKLKCSYQSVSKGVYFEDVYSGSPKNMRFLANHGEITNRNTSDE